MSRKQVQGDGGLPLRRQGGGQHTGQDGKQLALWATAAPTVQRDSGAVGGPGGRPDHGRQTPEPEAGLQPMLCTPFLSRRGRQGAPITPLRFKHAPMTHRPPATA